MRVAIIGAGAAGLVSAKYAFRSGHECEVLELAPQLGGTWLYTDDVGTDKYGYPVYSPMYKGLRTNLAKEVMGFSDFPIPEKEKSFLSQPEVLEFLNQYADAFHLKPLIRFNRHVTNVKPLEGNRWQVTSVDKPTKTEITDQYDAIMVCNGHYNEPYVPEFMGQEKFKGTIRHSHDYRSSEAFVDKRVLVIGAGPSGLDVTLQVCNVAEYVILSHHIKEAENVEYPANVEIKPDVKCIKDEEEVQFVDDTCCRFDDIILCTGYNYGFPFLDDSCGIAIDDNYVQPLYKHMVHIRRPTMCFIGIPYDVCAFPLFDLQAQFFVKFLDGKMTLPSTEIMLQDTEEDMYRRYSSGYSKRQAHKMGSYQNAYYKDLADQAQVACIPSVIVKLRDECVKRRYTHVMTFREDRYMIVDNDNFVRVQYVKE